MLRIIQLTTKLSYLFLCLLIIARELLKCFGYTIYNFEYKYIIQPIYEITNGLTFPIDYISYKLSPSLPLVIQKFFPAFFIKETNGTLEWPALITLAIILVIGVSIERAIKTISIVRNQENKNSLNRLNNETKEQKGKKQKRNDPSLKDAYNIIIKRLDREKTELVNKNISLEKEIITDTLTGLKTRKYMDDRLKYEFNNAKTRNNRLSLIMFDIDHFKSINDNLGHQTGDLVLKEVSTIIIKKCTKNIVASRYGGEEILVIAPKTPEKTAYNIAEAIRTDIQSSLRYGTSGKTQITISAGIATYSENKSITSAQHLIEMADKALYIAKNTGRNKTCIYSSEVSIKAKRQEESS